jgi:hypothetical protein
MDIYVGAIWAMDKEYALKIDPAWNDKLFIMVSKCGKYWCGWTDRTLKTNNMPMIGDELPKHGRVPMDEDLFGFWRDVREDLINNRLGDPIEGVNPLVKIAKSSGVCTCDLHVMMRNGCPSAKGGVCVNARDE